MKEEKKIIMFESDEAAQIKTVTGWVSSDGRFFGNDERGARYWGSTHHTCECGEIAERSYTKCEKCRRKMSHEQYLKMPFKEWDGKTPVCLYDSDTYFFDEDSLEDYLYENELNGCDVRLVICDPIHYSEVDYESIAGECHEDWEPSTELEAKTKEFNDYLRSLPAHSWYAGKTRTSYEYTFKEEDN